ncbi:hypothetical protein C8Q75DRAFT_801621 [Abortiporus biennis]|nr:hypothetical protein C8Q75DRAFT_801621 [Abortiporus biennis]
MADTELVFERSFYIGNALSLVALGIQIMMFLLSYYFMSTSTTKGAKGRNSTAFYTAFGAAMLVFDIIGTTCNLVFGQFAWIEHRDVAGGAAGFIGTNISAWYNTWGTASGFAGSYVADALLIYRCYIIWGSNWKIIVLPCLFYVASIPMAILNLFESAAPTSSFFAKNAVNFGVPYSSLTVAVNVVVTVFICYRLFVMRRWMQSFGMDETDVYTGIAAMMIESAAPVTICGIMYIVTYAKNIPSAIAFAIVYGSATVFSPQLIIFRTALGKAWSTDVTAKISTMHFESDRQRAVESGVPVQLSSGGTSSVTRTNTTGFASVTEKKWTDEASA